MRFVLVLVTTVIAFQAMAAELAREPDDTSAAHFGGPSSVAGQISSDNESRSPLFSLKEVTVQQRYYDFKEALQRDHGISFGLDYNFLYQYASQDSGGQNAAGGVIRLYGTWKPAGISAAHPGSLIVKIENRHDLGTDIAPKQLANELGYAGLTAVPFSDAGLLLTNLYWSQSFRNNNFSYVIGQVDTTDYVDIYGLVNPWVEFNNLAFTTNPAIPAPNQGLGAAARWTINNNYYVLAGLADANGDPAKPLDGFDSFFGDREYFKHIEFGWAGSWEQRFSDNIHLTLWDADEREQEGISGGWGAAFSFSREFGKLLPFLRVGYSDGGGALVDRSISTGFGYSPDRINDRFALGLAWDRPNSEIYGNVDDNQYTIETYYRLQMLKHLQLVPDIQVLLNPSSNPDEDSVWVFSLRGRLEF